MFGTETIGLKATQGCVYEEDLLSGGFLAACEYCLQMSYA